MIRVAKDGKRTLKSLNISVNPAHWDFTKSQPKGNCPNRNLIKQVILKVEMEYQSKVLDKEIKNEEFTALSLVTEKRDEIKAQTVEEFYLSVLNELLMKLYEVPVNHKDEKNVVPQNITELADLTKEIRHLIDSLKSPSK